MYHKRALKKPQLLNFKLTRLMLINDKNVKKRNEDFEVKTSTGESGENCCLEKTIEFRESICFRYSDVIQSILSVIVTSLAYTYVNLS